MLVSLAPAAPAASATFAASASASANALSMSLMVRQALAAAAFCAVSGDMQSRHRPSSTAAFANSAGGWPALRTNHDVYTYANPSATTTASAKLLCRDRRVQGARA